MNVFTVQIHYLSLGCVQFIVLIKMNVLNERVLLNLFMHNTAPRKSYKALLFFTITVSLNSAVAFLLFSLRFVYLLQTNYIYIPNTAISGFWSAIFVYAVFCSCLRELLRNRLLWGQFEGILAESYISLEQSLITHCHVRYPAEIAFYHDSNTPNVCQPCHTGQLPEHLLHVIQVIQVM